MTKPPPLPLRADLISDSQVRFGAGGAHAVDVTGLTREEAEEVTALGALTPAQWASARTSRPVSRRWPQVVRVLDAATKAVAADQSIGERVVALDGAGRLPHALTQLLPPEVATVGDPWQIAALAGSAATAPDLVVLFGSRAVAPHRYRPWQRLGVPHLPVVVGPRRLHIGPLAGTGQVCLRCVDLRRADRDPAWPRIVAAASAEHPGTLPDVLPAELLATGSGVLALAVGAALSASLPPGLSVSVSTAGPWVVHHRWTRHPACDCAVPPQVLPTTPPLREAG